MKYTVLFIQKNNRIFTDFSGFLTEYGFKCLHFPDCQEFFNNLVNNIPHIIITDTTDNLKTIRSWSDIPVIVISRHNDDSEQVNAFSMGADDFIMLPFSANILTARIYNALKHKRIPEQPPEKFRYGELEIDFGKRMVILSGKEIHLTPVEYNITELLCKNKGKVLTHEYILKQIWGPYISQDNKILRVNMTNIRRKLERDSKNPIYFRTEPGVGYFIK